MPFARRDPRCHDARAQEGAGCTAGCARRTGEAGFTLLEMLISIGLVALLMTGAVVGFGAVRRGRLRAGAAPVSSAFRFAYVHALTTGRATRVAFSLGSDQLWIEDTDDAHVLDTRDPMHVGGAASEVEAAAQQNAQLTLQVRPRAPRAQFTRPRGARFRTRRVERDVVLSRLYTSHDESALEEGTGYVYFFSGGRGERAVVHLRGGSGEIYSVLLHPLTGRSEIFDRPIEPPATEDRDTTDQIEVDERLQRPQEVTEP